MNHPSSVIQHGIQQALNELDYDAFFEEATLVRPCVYDVLVSYNASAARGHEMVVLDPLTETFAAVAVFCGALRTDPESGDDL